MRAILIAAALLLLPAAVAHAYTPTERALYTDGPSGRYLLDQGWSTARARGGPWRPVSIPNAFNARNYSQRSERSWVQWYRERFTLPSTTGSADVALNVTGPNNFHVSLPVTAGDVGAGQLAKISTTFAIPNAALWSPQHPNLYELTAMLPGGQTTTIQFGVRRWSKAPDG